MAIPGPGDEAEGAALGQAQGVESPGRWGATRVRVGDRGGFWPGVLLPQGQQFGWGQGPDGGTETKYFTVTATELKRWRHQTDFS